jgi:hypothetical protein
LAFPAAEPIKKPLPRHTKLKTTTCQHAGILSLEKAQNFLQLPLTRTNKFGLMLVLRGRLTAKIPASGGGLWMYIRQVCGSLPGKIH